MAFLYGQTTWSAFQDKFLDLISGQTADDQNVTCPAADRWRVRNGVSGSTAMAPPASQDEVVTQEHRQGYWVRFDDCCVYTDKSSSGKDYIRQKTIWTAWHANFREWVMVTARITVANTVASNYSTARVRISVVGIDGAGAPIAVANGTTLTPATDGTCTYTYNGCNITFQIGNADTGKVTVDGFYARAFHSTILGGVDWWPGAGLNVDSAHTFTGGLEPVGTLGSDYVVNIGPNSLSTSPAVTTDNGWYNGMEGWSATYGASINSTISSGLGILTTACLTGDRYEVSFTTQVASAVFKSSGGYIYLLWGGAGKNLDNSFVGPVEGAPNYVTSSQDFLHPAPYSGVSIVQYWISVTATHIAIVLNTEGQSSWTITANLYCKVTGDEEEDGTCWFAGVNGGAYQWYRYGAHSFFERARRLGKGVRDGGRDWQTGMGRSDTMPLANYAYWQQGWHAQSFYASVRALNYMRNSGGTSYNTTLPIVPWRANGVPIVDRRVLLSGFELMDYDRTNQGYDSDSRFVGAFRYRGYVCEGLYLTPDQGYAQGDELTDTLTGDKYLLWLGGTDIFPGLTPMQYNPGIALEEK